MNNRDLPEGFRMTELGPLPEEWEVVKLGEVAEARYGKATPVTRGSVPVVGSGGIFANTNIPLVSHPTLVIGRKGTAGKVWLFQSPCYPSDTTFYLQWKNEIDVSFVFYFLTLRPLSGEHAKTTLPSLQKSFLENTLIPLPPLPEQRAIAQVLRTVQQAKEATERVIAAARELKKSLMRHLFTYGPVPVNQVDGVRLKETAIGPVPEGWEVVRIGDLATVRGGVGFPHKYQGQAQGEYPFIKVSDMNLPGNETHIVRANHYVNGNVLMVLKGRPFPPGTTVFPKVGAALHTNKKRLLTCPTLIDNNMMGIVPTTPERCTPEFLFRLFENTNISDFSNPGPLPSINANAVKAASVALPPIDDQIVIEAALNAVDRKIQAEEQRKAALDALFRTLLHHLMTGKVRVGGAITEPEE